MIGPPSTVSRSDTTEQAAVVVNGITKIYQSPFRRRQVVAVNHLNLRVGSGQIYGLLGPNGSGKSTTLKIILGLVSPTRGRVEIFGQANHRLKIRESIGF